jgi:hypothetical protein
MLTIMSSCAVSMGMGSEELAGDYNRVKSDSHKQYI